MGSVEQPFYLWVEGGKGGKVRKKVWKLGKGDSRRIVGEKREVGKEVGRWKEAGRR